jgi:hypothetical protein
MKNFNHCAWSRKKLKRYLEKKKILYQKGQVEKGYYVPNRNKVDSTNNICH